MPRDTNYVFFIFINTVYSLKFVTMKLSQILNALQYNISCSIPDSITWL